MEELLVDRGVGADHVIVHRWMQWLTPLSPRALKPLTVVPSEVVTDANPTCPRGPDELLPSAWHHVERHADNPIEADHEQLEHRPRSMHEPRSDRSVQTIITGHALGQNLRREHYELATDVPPSLRVAAAFTELARAI